MNWSEPAAVAEALKSRQQSIKTLVVPSLVGSSGYECVRLKVIKLEEYTNLEQDCTLKPNEIERVESNCKEIVFFFAFESEDLGSAPGILYAHWAKNPNVTKLQVNYAFAKASLNCFGMGYDSRETAPSQGLNSFFKAPGRGNKRPFSSPIQADEDIPKQQYYRDSFKDQLVQPKVRKVINALAENVSGVARAVNPILMKMVRNICTRNILTTGQVPEDKNKDPNRLPQGGSSKWPIPSFANTSHFDARDKLTVEQRNTWKQQVEQDIQNPPRTAKYMTKRGRHMREREGQLRYLLRLLNEEDFCLPTTCGYQFVFQGDAEKELDVHAFFAMDGLGVAMAIDHGVMQHFMGAMFSHQTCLAIMHHRNDGRVSLSNADDDFLIIGWGSSGGRTEVAEKNTKKA